MADSLTGPVGLRWRTQNVANKDSDQKKVIALLAAISKSDGGKSEDWGTPPLSGGDKMCPKLLADAIWDFQVHWKSKGVFHLIDGVVDPGLHTWQKLNQMAKRGGGGPVGPVTPPDTPKPKLIWTEPQIPGAWQITNIWSLAVGEIGLLGGADLEISPPDGKKFKMKGIGAGFGASIDPKGMVQLMKDVEEPAAQLALKPLLTLLGTGAVFNLGDYLQKFGVSLSSVTGGRIFVNPINQYVGRPTRVSRYAIAGGLRPPFFITSAGAGFAAGMEAGYVRLGQAVLYPDFIGIYGTSGVNLKFGAGVQGMMYYTYDVVDS